MIQRLVLMMMLVATVGPAARGDVLSLTTDLDNTLYESPDGASSNGIGEHVFAGRTASGYLRRALLRFDVSAIPAGSQINDVALTLYMSRTIAAGEIVEVHKVTAPWGEGTSDALDEEGNGAPSTINDATWIHAFYPGTAWTTPGGDFDSNVSASQIIYDIGYYTWNSPGLVSDVQGWLNGTDDNNGWILTGNEFAKATAKRFDSRENPIAAVWPQLVVDYTPVPEPGSMAVLLIILILARPSNKPVRISVRTLRQFQ